MARHKVEICGVDTANIKVLSYDEQVKLFKKFKNGDLKAKEDLINGNLKLVLSILKSFAGRCDNMDDLFQVGTIGLIKAIDNFDLSHNVKFSTYAVPMILGEVKRYLRDNNSVRISRSVKDLAYKSLKVKEEFLNLESREPTTLEIANILGVSEFDVCNALNSLKDTVSMYEPIYSDGGDVIYLADQLSNKDDLYDIETKIALKKALDKIREKERYILVQRYMIGKTQMELASEIGISQAQISRLEKNGLDSIKKLIK
ncbi:MAG: SigB/SigF/SigG family RNA polymerase sigma factor [Bacilli bacterium]|nr:SigB/SigF/SigG family RNA polymerase sigma factor [Bacilli bacterium]